MLPQANRLHLDKDIKTLFATGKGVFGVSCGLKLRKNGLNISRFAVVVGVKVSKRAVERNRLRRQIREIVRTRLETLKPGYDVMMLVRREALGLSFETLEKQVVALLRKAGLL